MDNNFTFNLEYKGTRYELTAVFIRLGYIHQFHVQFNGNTFILEFDEERNYRLIDPNHSFGDTVDTGMLEAIVRKVSYLHE